jgi:fatty acid CoA ligase FadD9
MVGFASPDYAITDFACLYLGATSVPLQSNLRPQDLAHIINEAEFGLLVCSIDQLDSVSAIIAECPTIFRLTIIDYLEGDTDQAATLSRLKEQIKEKRPSLRVQTIGEIEALGQKKGPVGVVIPAPGTDPIMTLCYTSGSTGFPKGAMFPESLWTGTWKNPSVIEFFEVPQITVNYSPMNHMMGRLGIIQCLNNGGCLCFTLKNDMSTLFEDIRIVRPTVLTLVPRVGEMIYQSYRTRLVQEGIGAKEKILAQMGREYLGNRLVMIITGSAPTAPEVRAFLQDCFQVPIFEAYASTEAGGISFENRILRQFVTDYKLVDVPELSYYSTDKPYPRGELHLKTTRTIPGYFKNESATRALFDEQGYSNTGDIVEKRSAEEVVWIDRKNNVLKLSQGEFVTIWRLEALYGSGSPFIKQAYVYGNSERSYLLAVIVPDIEAARSRLTSKKEEATDEAVKRLIRSELNAIARKNELRAFEIPRDFLVEKEPFTQGNGLLTGINKPARTQLKAKYSAQLESLYQELERRQVEEIGNLAKHGSDLPIAEKVRKAIESTLGVSGIDFNDAQSFHDLGGDSLHAVTLAGFLESLCGIKVPVGIILNPEATLLDLVQYVEKNLSGDASSHRVSFSDIHGDDPREIRREDLRLERFLSDTERTSADKLRGTPLPKESKSFFLTGANGFLGRFLCLELLQRVQATGGKVYCIVRAKNDEAAVGRLHEVFTSDPLLEEEFSRLALKHLVVLAGDLVLPRLGLREETYDLVAREVDTIVHPGALVNHALGYRDVFEPNVLGTVEIARLALSQRLKRINYLSTIGVLSGIHRVVREDEEVRDLRDAWPITHTAYGEGYSISKWASEILLRDLNDKFAAPVNIFRGDMMLPHRRFRGQINQPDLFTRLLYSVIWTKVVPETFYLSDKKNPDRPHYDGLPVDFIAGAIAAISAGTYQRYSTYHVSNVHWDDGISLDTIVDWVESDGYFLERVSDYGRWFRLFQQKLKSLDLSQRQHSSLPIIQMWQAPSETDEGRKFDATGFREKVKELKPNGVEDIPHLPEAFIHKYLADMRYLKLIGLPTIPAIQKLQPKQAVRPPLPGGEAMTG